MAEIKAQRNFSYWLFADKLQPQGDIFEIDDYNPEHVTRNAKLVPVLTLLGATKDGKAGDFYISTWNILNLNDCLKSWGTDSVQWIGKKIRILPVGKKVRIIDHYEDINEEKIV